MIRNDYKSQLITTELLHFLACKGSEGITENALCSFLKNGDAVPVVIDDLKEHHLISSAADVSGTYAINQRLISKRELSEVECVLYGDTLSENAVIFQILLYKIQRHITAYEKTNPPALAELLSKNLVYLFDDYYCSGISLNSTEAIFNRRRNNGVSSENRILFNRFKQTISEWQKYGI